MFIHGASSPKMPIFQDSGSLLQASYLNHKATVLFILTFIDFSVDHTQDPTMNFKLFYVQA